MFKKICLILSAFHSMMYGYIQFGSPQEALAIIGSYMPDNPIILEAGAYDGSDSVNLAMTFQNSKVYCFEPIPYLFQKVVRQIQKVPHRIFAYSYALSDSTGKAKMYVSEDPGIPNGPSASSSLLAPKDHLLLCPHVQFKKEVEVQTITIDEWAAQNGVDHIDLMWLDMQGYELNALKASPNILKTVKAILTEVEFVEAYQGQYQFKDVKEWLEKQGFTLIAGCFGSWYGDAIFVRI